MNVPKTRQQARKRDRHWYLLAIILGITLLMSLCGRAIAPAIGAEELSPLQAPSTAETDTSSLTDQRFLLPTPRPHPLPDSLASWEDRTNQGDYFDAIAPTVLGYLVWTEFPITIFVEPPNVEPPNDSESFDIPTSLPESTSNSSLNTKLQARPLAASASSPSAITRQLSPPTQRIQSQWYESVLSAINEWSAYLPIEQSDEKATADIAILATAPPLQVSFDESGLLLGRARSAETRYEFYIEERIDGTQLLLPKYTVMIKPGQSPQQIRATARHELGHALGLWGHSPLSTDALYASQVQSPSELSVRDITTLKRVYEQATQLGWPLPVQSDP
ncbi:MAG: matrixin family metalloprotease [Cyanobacteria bacterium P01_A01_bin.37]